VGMGMGMGMVLWEWEGMGTEIVLPAHLYSEVT